MAIKKLLPDWQILPTNEIEQNKRLTDFLIWKFAKANNYTILTFDEDFSELQNLYSFPPKIIWLRIGNATTSEIANILIKFKYEIEKFIQDEELGVYEIFVL